MWVGFNLNWTHLCLIYSKPDLTCEVEYKVSGGCQGFIQDRLWFPTGCMKCAFSILPPCSLFPFSSSPLLSSPLPPGKTDQSAAGVAYDALVNQLLTLMDGLSEVHNILVVGLTNRRELLDPALLRPGRYLVTKSCHECVV